MNKKKIKKSRRRKRVFALSTSWMKPSYGSLPLLMTLSRLHDAVRWQIPTLNKYNVFFWMNINTMSTNHLLYLKKKKNWLTVLKNLTLYLFLILNGFYNIFMLLEWSTFYYYYYSFFPPSKRKTTKSQRVEITLQKKLDNGCPNF